MKRFFITGFTGFSDLLSTLYKVKSITINLGSLVLVNLVAFAGFLYSPHEMVITLFTLMLMDWGTGVYKAVKLKRFSSYTFQRMMWNIFFTAFLIGTSTMLGNHLWVFKALHIADMMITGFLITYFVSIIENLHEIDKRIIPDKLFIILTKALQLDSIINRYFKNDATKEETETAIDTLATSAEPISLPDTEGSEPNNQN